MGRAVVECKPGYSQKHQSWYVPLTQGVIALVDAEDVPEIAQHCWTACRSKRRWKAIRNPWGEAVVMMHRQIMSPPDGAFVDHIHHAPLDAGVVDNRKVNLRVCTHQENCMNRSPQNSRGKTTSKFKGVYWERACNKWRAQISVRGKTQHIGVFPKEEDAARAYDGAAVLEYGEFALTNASLDLFERRA